VGRFEVARCVLIEMRGDVLILHMGWDWMALNRDEVCIDSVVLD